jgi:hypothetical protein
MPEHSPRTRDAALGRLRSLNRWLIAASAALTGIFTAVAANAFPGHTLKTASKAASHSTKNDSSTGSRSRPSRLRAPSSAPKSSEESGTSSSEEGEGTQNSEATTPSESESSPSQATTQPRSEEPSEPEKPAAAEKAAETTAEAPVVSGGS